jgi:hypothetical protein
MGFGSACAGGVCSSPVTFSPCLIVLLPPKGWTTAAAAAASGRHGARQAATSSWAAAGAAGWDEGHTAYTAKDALWCCCSPTLGNLCTQKTDAHCIATCWCVLI